MYSKIIVTRKYFTPEWCDNVNNYVSSNVEVDPNFGKRGVRICKVRNIMPNCPIFKDVFDPMMDYVIKHAPILNVDINNQIDGAIQHITYETGDGVGWHDDTKSVSDAFNLKTNRKLSMTVVLSDPSDYTGGEFVFDKAVKMPFPVKDKGTVALFTSHAPHMVTNVTSGKRNILFIFVTGPDWR
jgi:predicted 2-oxoglutarate/Fe(II)-dependent dioxygenase YbiX